MRALLALLALLLGAPAYGQPVSSFVQGPSGAYSGPGDKGVTLTDCWGAEKCTSAYSGHALLACTFAASPVCTEIDYTATGDLNTSQLTSAGCTVDGVLLSNVGCGVKTLHSNYGGCDLTSTSSTNWPPLLVVSKQNGHVALGAIAVSLGLNCTLGASTTDASFITFAASGGSIPIFGILATSGNDELRLWVYSGDSNAYSTWFDDSTFQNSGSTGGTFVGALHQYTAQLHLSVSSGLTQLIVDGTAQTGSTTNAGAVTGTLTTAHWSSNGNAGSGAGTQSAALISPHATNANTNTVGHVMCVFWQASPAC